MEVYNTPCDDFAICLDHQNAVNLIRDVEVLKDYSLKAWFLCGEPAKEKKKPNESTPPSGPDVPL